LGLPCAWALQGLGNHGLWLSFLLFMLLRSLTLAAFAWNLGKHDSWFAGAH
jgi:MATE family multidrug resistance protein